MNSQTHARPRRGHAAACVVVLALAATALGNPADSDAAPAAPVPADCGPGSEPETAEQGRVPKADYDSGRVDRPYTCNTELVSHVAGTGGFKVHRYVDDAGRECAYYDTQLVLGNELLTQIQTQGLGVAVVDLTDPQNPVQTASLTTPAMLSPHESLEIHHGRGLLVAAMGTAATLPGFVDVYDVSGDCRSPRLLSTTPLGLLGHESAISPDGNTFYVSATAFNLIAAIDISDPSMPTPVTYANLNSHGMNVSDDGTRLYTTPLDVGAPLLPTDDGNLETGLAIVDVSAVQNREGLLSDLFDGDGRSLPDPSGGLLPPMPTVSEVVFPDGTIAQTAIPVTIGGNPFLITIDEFVDFVDMVDPLHAAPGIGRIFDVSDETDPTLVSTLELEVHQADTRPGLVGDPGAGVGFHSYAGHYCAVPQREDPGIVACSFLLSGLRIFDIEDPAAPREIAYFNGGRGSPSPVNLEGAPYALSAPAFVPERNEIWYSDGASGLWALRVTNDVWNSDGEETAAEVEPPVTPQPTSRPAGTLPATGSDRPPLTAVLLVIAGAMLALWIGRRPSVGSSGR